MLGLLAKATGSIALLSVLSGAVEPPRPVECHLRVGRAIGCQGDDQTALENAIAMFGTFGLDRARLAEDYARDYAQNYMCTRITETPGQMSYTFIRGGRLATPSGYMVGHFTSIHFPKRSVWIWIADAYFDRPCRSFTAADQSEVTRQQDALQE